MRIIYIYTLRMIIMNIKRLCQMHIVADSTTEKKESSFFKFWTIILF